jgi:hypothetical protein
MSRTFLRNLILPVALPGLLSAAPDAWKEPFDVPAGNFSSTGKNKYFSIEPGYQLVLEGEEDGRKTSLVITVLDETKTVEGIETRVVEERESAGGVPIEVSRNFFAIDRKTGDVYYFGEDVDEYKNGKIASHGGSWLAGKNGARYGLFMPAAPKVGQKFYQEIAPKVAMDRAQIVSVDEAVKVPAGSFKNCLKVEETTPLEADTKEHKLYAPEVGLLTDGGMKLVKYGMKAK